MRWPTQNDIQNGLELQKHYDVLHSDNLEELIFAVNMAIKNGWEPLGGVTPYISQHSNRFFTQTMIAKNPMRGDAAQDFYYQEHELQDLKYSLPEYN